MSIVKIGNSLREEPFNIYWEGTSFEMMHAIFLGEFFSDMTVSKQFFSWKIFGMSPWHILVVKGMMCNRL